MTGVISSSDLEILDDVYLGKGKAPPTCWFALELLDGQIRMKTWSSTKKVDSFRDNKLVRRVLRPVIINERSAKAARKKLMKMDKMLVETSFANPVQRKYYKEM